MVRLAVTYHNGTTLYYDAMAGWRIDPRTRCLVVGRGVPRTHVPLDTVAAIDVLGDVS